MEAESQSLTGLCGICAFFSKIVKRQIGDSLSPIWNDRW